MRASYGGSLLFSDDKLIGINLGSDSCAEHEWGIKDIQYEFGIDIAAGYGLARRTPTKVSPNLIWFKKKIAKTNYVGFAMERFFDGVDKWEPRDGLYRTCDKENMFHAGWDQEGFYVLAEAKNKKAIVHLKELFEAIQNLNICVWTGGGGVFKNSGLCLGIVNKMPTEIFDQWYECDKKKAELQKEFYDTGVQDLLFKAGKKWYALSPNRDIHGKLMVWLNPCEQDRHNFGWFSVEDLKLWAEGKGPVMMTEAEKAENKKNRH